MKIFNKEKFYTLLSQGKMDEDWSSEGMKTIVGGAPVTEKFTKEIGADRYVPDAASAVDMVKSFLILKRVFITSYS